MVLILLVINIKVSYDLTAIRFKRVTKFEEVISQLVQLQAFKREVNSQVNGVVEIWLSPRLFPSPSLDFYFLNNTDKVSSEYQEPCTEIL